VPAAKAEVTAAKVFNDPNLSVSYFNNENNSLQMGEGVEVELSKTFSFGKRGANIWRKEAWIVCGVASR
jgi:cobalt-zinc-cadmium efflux system outer membrane protein